VEALRGQQCPAVGRLRHRGGDQGGVGDDPARGDVTLRGDLVARLPQCTHGPEGAPSAHAVHPRRTTPRLVAHGRDKATQVVELLARPLGLARLLQLGGQAVAQLDEHLDVQRGVLEPGGGQRARGPVGGRVLLLHPEAQQGLDQGREPDARVAEEPSGELGVEQRVGVQPDLVEAGEVLGRGVQDPLGAGQDLLQRCHRGEGDGVDQRGATAVAAQLDEVGPVGVAVARGPLGVDGDRSGALGQAPAHLGQPGLGLGDLGQTVGQGQQLGLLLGLGLIGLIGLIGRIGLGCDVDGISRAHPWEPR